MRQARQRLHRDVGNRAARHIVDDDRDVHRIGDRLEVGVEAILGWLVVIGHHHQRGIGTGFAGVKGEVEGLARRVGARAGNHRNPALDLVDADLDHALVFIGIQRRALAGGAHGHNAMGALRDLPVHEFPERGLVDLAILHGRDEGREGSSELHVDYSGNDLKVRSWKPWRA